jgi:hypothetical protein|uniref:Uncharacterized protein n=1 Tax=viral metagenome TaxID=1070528 RepID=A0A6C0IRE2_9ZZZZ
MQLKFQSSSKAVTSVNGKVQNIRENEIIYDGDRAKIKARNNNKVTFADLKHKDVKNLFKKPPSSKSLQENLEFLLKKPKRSKSRRKKRKKKRKTKKKCRYKIGSKKGKFKKC